MKRLIAKFLLLLMLFYSLPVYAYIDYNTVCKNNKCGIISRNDTMVLPLEYDEIISLPTGDRYIIEKDSKQSVIDIKNNKVKTLLPYKYDYLEHLFYIFRNKTDKSVFIAKENGKYGLIEISNKPKKYFKTLLSFQNDKIVELANDCVAYKTSKGIKIVKMNFDNDSLEDVIELNYDDIKRMDSYYAVKKGKLWGVVSIENGKVNTLIKPMYEEMVRCGYSGIIVQKNGHKGLINSKNEILIPVKYDELQRFSDNALDNTFMLKKGSRVSLLDISKNKKKETVLNTAKKIHYDERKLINPYDYIYAIKQNGKWKAVKPLFDSLDEEVWILSDMEFDDVINTKYFLKDDTLYYVNEDSGFKIKKCNIDEDEAKMLIANKDKVYEYEPYGADKTLTVTKQGDKYGLIKNNEILLENKYDKVSPAEYVKGYAFINQDDKIAIYNTRTKKLTDFKYDFAYENTKGSITAYEGNNKKHFAKSRTVGAKILNAPYRICAAIGMTLAIVSFSGVFVMFVLDENGTLDYLEEKFLPIKIPSNNYFH